MLQDAYLLHPTHLKVVDLAQPKLERLVVFDFDVPQINSSLS